MLSGLMLILLKIKWWLAKSGTLRMQCHGFCPTCSYYDLCVADENNEYEEDEFDWYADADYDYPWD